MSQNARYFRVGLFVLAGTALLAAGVIALGAGEMFEDKLRFESYFEESVQGLEVGAPVKYRGVQIGSVERITFVGALHPTQESSNDVAVITALSTRVLRGRSLGDFQEDMAKRIKDGLRIRLASAGIAGGMYLEVDYVDPEKFPLKEPAWTTTYAYCPSTPSTGARLTESVESVLDSIKAMKIHDLSAELQGVIVDLRNVLRDDLQPILKDVGTAAATLPDTFAKASTVIDRIDALVREISPAAASLNEAIGGVNAATKELPATITQANRTFKRADNLVTGQQDAIDQILDNLRVVSSDLKELTSTVKRYPATVLFGDPPPKKEKP